MADENVDGISITFALDAHRDTHEPEISVWIDANDDGVLTDNERIKMTKDGLEWKGTHRFPKAVPAKGSKIRVQFFASKGASWSFEVTDINDPKTKLAHITKAVVERPFTKFWYVL